MFEHRWPWLSLAVIGLVVLARAQAQGDKKAPPPAGGKSSDVELVERLLAARKEYQLTLEELRKHYIRTGDLPKARWAEDELMQYHRIGKQAFKLELELPPPTLKADLNIPEANKLYRQAMNYKDKGWGTDYIDNQRRAEILLQKILTEYPQSNKISHTAYQLGDLYEGKAYQQYARAAGYFERCFQWNPKTQFDARIRAARLYERQLNDRGRAAEIYKEIQTHETDEKHIEEAKKRLQDLSTRK
jgi:tetratricopeptide (TPR) repeat protein